MNLSYIEFVITHHISNKAKKVYLAAAGIIHAYITNIDKFFI